MNILIVNLFENKTLKNLNRYKELKSNIEILLKQTSIRFGVDNYYLYERNYNNLDDMIKFKTSETLPTHKVDLCDLIDIIFIVGSQKFMPHKPEGYKLLSLIKYAKHDHKPLFCTGVSFFSLLFNLSVNFDLDLNIVNITKDFQTIEDFPKIPKKMISEFTLKDRFFDFATGDMYQHSLNKDIWKPLENAGYHNRIIASKYNNRGSLVTFMEENKKEKKINEKFYQGVNCEVTCNIMKQIVRHWLIKDLPFSFEVDSDSDWDAHPIVFTKEANEYKILLDSSKGIMMVEHQETIACNFYISNKYPQSVKILKTFLEKYFEEIFLTFNNKKKLKVMSLAEKIFQETFKFDNVNLKTEEELENTNNNTNNNYNNNSENNIGGMSRSKIKATSKLEGKKIKKKGEENSNNNINNNKDNNNTTLFNITTNNTTMRTNVMPESLLTSHLNIENEEEKYNERLKAKEKAKEEEDRKMIEVPKVFPKSSLSKTKESANYFQEVVEKRMGNHCGLCFSKKKIIYTKYNSVTSEVMSDSKEKKFHGISFKNKFEDRYFNYQQNSTADGENHLVKRQEDKIGSNVEQRLKEKQRKEQQKTKNQEEVKENTTIKEEDSENETEKQKSNGINDYNNMYSSAVSANKISLNFNNNYENATINSSIKKYKSSNISPFVNETINREGFFVDKLVQKNMNDNELANYYINKRREITKIMIDDMNKVITSENRSDGLNDGSGLVTENDAEDRPQGSSRKFKTIKYTTTSKNSFNTSNTTSNNNNALNSNNANKSININRNKNSNLFNSSNSQFSYTNSVHFAKSLVKSIKNNAMKAAKDSIDFNNKVKSKNVVNLGFGGGLGAVLGKGSGVVCEEGNIKDVKMNNFFVNEYDFDWGKYDHSFKKDMKGKRNIHSATPTSILNKNTSTTTSSSALLNTNKNITCEYDEVLTNQEYRKFMFHNLYPYINYELVPKEKETFIPEKTLEKIHLQRDVCRLNLSKRQFYCNYNKKFRKFESELDTFAVKTCVRGSSAYIPADAKRRIEDIENKRKWVGESDFKAVFPVARKEGDGPVVSCHVGEGGVHNFRDLDRDKWISGEFKFKY